MLSRCSFAHRCLHRAYSTAVEEAHPLPSSSWPYAKPRPPNTSRTHNAYPAVDNPNAPVIAKGMDQMVYIKIPKDVSGLPHGLAVLRAVEKKYGPCRDHNFPKLYTSSRPSDYRSFAHISLADSKAFESLTAEGEADLEVTLPKFDRDTPGGAGLEDILPLLLRQSRDDPKLWSEDKINVQISRAQVASRRLSLDQEETASVRRARGAAMCFNFAQWHGFYSGPRGPRMQDALENTRKVIGSPAFNRMVRSPQAVPEALPARQGAQVKIQPQLELESEVAEAELTEIRDIPDVPVQPMSFAEIVAARQEALRQAEAKAVVSQASTTTSTPKAAKASKSDKIPKQNRVLMRQKMLAKQAQGSKPSEKVKGAETAKGERKDESKQGSTISKLFGFFGSGR